jgi:hypothetical protein
VSASLVKSWAIEAVRLFAIIAALALSACSSETDPVIHYQPTLSITQSPGCSSQSIGFAGMTPAEKIAYTRVLAEFYFLNQQQAAASRKNYGWGRWNCLDADATALIGGLDPTGIPVKLVDLPATFGRQLPLLPINNSTELSKLQQAYFDKLPDWRPLDDSLVVIPFDEGVFFRFIYTGHDVSGQEYKMWQSMLALVGDEGKISHVEIWNDMAEWSSVHERVFDEQLDVSRALSAVVPPGNEDARTGTIQYYQPVLDITEDPGCGEELNSEEDRIARNRKLAELYFVNFQEYFVRNENYNWWIHGCAGAGTKMLLGSVEPQAEPNGLVDLLKATGIKGIISGFLSDQRKLNPEQLAYLDAYETYGPMPGSLVVIPFENGAYFRMVYNGKSKQDGSEDRIWETNVILVDDAGMIKHFELWNDNIGWDITNRKVFGISLYEVDGLPSYIKLMHDRLEEKRSQTD